jgi:hypothetical protein
MAGVLSTRPSGEHVRRVTPDIGAVAAQVKPGRLIGVAVAAPRGHARQRHRSVRVLVMPATLREQPGQQPGEPPHNLDEVRPDTSSGTATTPRGSRRRSALAAAAAAAWSSVTIGERSLVNGDMPSRSDTTHTPA